jgi:hypothetical protein
MTSAPPPAPPGTLRWTGDPSKGQGVFFSNNCAAPGTLTTTSDSQHGQVWAYHKPAGDKRCESHGIQVGGGKYTFQNNSTYYIGWWSKLTDLTDNNADFQWKSYGAGMTQNYPFVISVHGGHAGVWQQQPSVPGVTAWTSAQALTPGQWVHYVVGVHTSDQLRGGWIQLWFNGVPQTFADGSTQYHCRTFDVQNDPKWGEYGAQGADVTNFVAGQKIGTSYDVVAN